MSCWQCCQDLCKLFDLQNKCSQIKTISLWQQWFSSNVLPVACTEALSKLNIWERIETREAGGDLLFLYKFYPASAYKSHSCWTLADTEMPQKANLIERVLPTESCLNHLSRKGNSKKQSNDFALNFWREQIPEFPELFMFLLKGKLWEGRKKKRNICWWVGCGLEYFLSPQKLALDSFNKAVIGSVCFQGNKTN